MDPLADRVSHSNMSEDAANNSSNRPNGSVAGPSASDATLVTPVTSTLQPAQSNRHLRLEMQAPRVLSFLQSSTRS